MVSLATSSMINPLLRRKPPTEEENLPIEGPGDVQTPASFFLGELRLRASIQSDTPRPYAPGKCQRSAKQEFEQSRPSSSPCGPAQHRLPTSELPKQVKVWLCGVRVAADRGPAPYTMESRTSAATRMSRQTAERAYHQVSLLISVPAYQDRQITIQN